MSPLPLQRGMWFEEYEVGQKVFTAGRTVTETDVVNFAGVSGDFNQIHTDAQFTADDHFGQRVAHGLLVLSIASGLAIRTGMLEGTVIAFREITNWKFMKPIFLGDTIHVQLEVVKTKAMSRIGGGSVEIEVSVINQDDVVVMKGVWVVLVHSTPE